MNFFNRFRSRIRRSRPLILEFQKLEDRNLLAGDVTVFLNGGSLFITGDAQDNQVQIIGTLAGSAQVVGLDGTTINGGSSAFDANFPGIRSATINLGGGSDTFSAEGVRFNRGLEINAGAGNDNLTVRHSSVGQMILRGQDGNDTLTIDNLFTIGSADISLGNGTNMLAVMAQAAGEDIRVRGGSGADTFVVANMGMFGAMNIDLAGGNDNVLMAGETWVGRDSTIALGTGDDFFGVLPEQLGAKSQLQKFVMIDGGGGADNFSFGSQVTTKRGTTVNGSNGTDGIRYGNADFTNADVLSFENNSFDQTALLDSVYEALEAEGFESEMFGGDIIPDFAASVADVFLTLPENSDPISIDSNLTLAGPEETVVTQAVVTLEGFQAGQDVLSFVDTADIVGTFNETTGVLTLVGESSLTDYQTALRSVTVSNTSEDPSTADRTLVVEVTNSDGEVVTDSRTLNVVSVTDAPVISVDDTPINFDLDDTEFTRPAILDAALVVSDVDTQQFTSATVSITEGFQPGDELSFTAADGITSEYDSVNGVLTLTGEATVEQYQNALRSVTFDSTSDAVRVGSRTIRFTVTDGANGATDEIEVAVASTKLTIDTGSETTDFTEKDEPVVIAADLTLETGSDTDAVISGAVVRVTEGYVSGEDLISFLPFDGIEGSLDEAAGILTLTGDATAASYLKVLQNVTYGNNDVDNDITAGTRTFEFAVQRDGVEVAASKSVDVNRMTDEEKIQAFLTENGLTSEVTDSGLHYIVNQEGNGNFPQENQTVNVNYTGRLLDGTQFDASTPGTPFQATLSLNRLIAGWVEGIPKFSEGGTGRLLIPANLAYGAAGQGTIPPNAVLDFDIEVLDILS